MPIIAPYGGSQVADPLESIEGFMERSDWTFDRRSDDELAAQAPGTWCDYSLYFAWNIDAKALHFSCAFDMRVPATRRSQVRELLALINDKVWLGHFGMWEEEGLPLFRHAMPLRGTNGATAEQVEDMIDAALFECERFYPAFQHLIWGGNTAEEAVRAAMVDTLGEA